MYVSAECHALKSLYLTFPSAPVLNNHADPEKFSVK